MKKHAKKPDFFLKMVFPMLLHDKERILRDFWKIPSIFQIFIIFGAIFLVLFEHFIAFYDVFKSSFL